MPIRLRFAILIFSAIFLFGLIVLSGTVSISVVEIGKAFLGIETTSSTSQLIVWNIRLPKALTALGVGMGLAVSGVLLQTLFRNPLAGPGIIGVSSGASMGVGLVILGNSALMLSSSFFATLSVPLAALMGSLAMLTFLLLLSFRVAGNVSLLIIGMMVGNFSLAIIGIWQHAARPEEVQQFALWLMGSLQATGFAQALVIMLITLLITSIMWLKSPKMDIFLLGTDYAASMGIAEKEIRWWCIALSGLLVGITTAYCGPIAFIGLAAPHLARSWFKTSLHRVILPAAALMGANLLCLCAWLAELPNASEALPINAVTTLIGSPLVISMILRSRFSEKSF